MKSIIALLALAGCCLSVFAAPVVDHRNPGELLSYLEAVRNSLPAMETLASGVTVEEFDKLSKEPLDMNDIAKSWEYFLGIDQETFESFKEHFPRVYCYGKALKNTFTNGFVGHRDENGNVERVNLEGLVEEYKKQRDAELKNPNNVSQLKGTPLGNLVDALVTGTPMMSEQLVEEANKHFWQVLAPFADGDDEFDGLISVERRATIFGNLPMLMVRSAIPSLAKQHLPSNLNELRTNFLESLKENGYGVQSGEITKN